MEKGKYVQMSMGEFQYSSDHNGMGILSKANKILANVEYREHEDKYFVDWIRAQQELKNEFDSIESIIVFTEENIKRVERLMKFKHYLHDSKESIYWVLSDKDRGLGLSDEEIEENNLVYAFYEVEFDCEYENGEIYITHCNGVKLEERVEA